jgi:hypothetical protein
LGTQLARVVATDAEAEDLAILMKELDSSYQLFMVRISAFE